MLVENTKENRDLKRVTASMAIENMYLEKEFISQLLDVEMGKRSSEDLRQEVIRKYAR